MQLQRVYLLCLLLHIVGFFLWNCSSAYIIVVIILNSEIQQIDDIDHRSTQHNKQFSLVKIEEHLAKMLLLLGSLSMHSVKGS